MKKYLIFLLLFSIHADANSNSKVSNYIRNIEYPVEHYPDLAKLVGKKNLVGLNKRTNDVADYVADNKNCDFVEDAFPSQKQIDKNNLTFIVDCKNGQRFTVKEAEVQSKKQIQSNTQLAISQSKAIDTCKDYIKKNVSKNADIHSIFGSSYRVGSTGTVVVNLDFDLENVFGKKEKYTAICTYEKLTWELDVLITER